jgi:hypothetical protein
VLFALLAFLLDFVEGLGEALERILVGRGRAAARVCFGDAGCATSCYSLTRRSEVRLRGQSGNQNRQVKLPLTEWSCALLASWPA